MMRTFIYRHAFGWRRNRTGALLARLNGILLIEPDDGEVRP